MQLLVHSIVFKIKSILIKFTFDLSDIMYDVARNYNNMPRS